MPYNFTAIEKKWQKYWLENKTFAALEPADAGRMPKAYILDMFPYPSGAGLHVGHPEGYTATDIVARFRRMQGYNVLHPMGWDAFGLPAEQYAIKHQTHPRQTTESNIRNFRRQIQMLGLSYDWDREIDTTDPDYYKWTQWIFLQLFNSYFDPVDKMARPISHLLQELVSENLVVAPDGSVRLNPSQEGLEEIAGEVRIERLWRELSHEEQQDIVDGLRLAYMDEAPVNWCPQLGTVLANEEVIDGKSDVGGFPVERRPMRQWMLRITAYADRLVDDLNLLTWPESLKDMQRNWIGRSIGAEVDFDIEGAEDQIEASEGENRAGEDSFISVFTTRPDTLYGATYVVLAPEHPLLDKIIPPSHASDVETYRKTIGGRSDRDRMAETKDKTGVFTGAFAINPVNDEKIPIYIADYVLMGYGTGAIMAVPAHDERDFEFAMKFHLPIRAVLMPDDHWLMTHKPADIAASASAEALRSAYVKNAALWTAAFTGDGISINSDVINGLPTAEAKDKIIDLLEEQGLGHRAVKYKLRDWLFSRQRYWGEPFPIVLDAKGNAFAIDENELPLELPEMADFQPTGTPEGPLSKAEDWLKVPSAREVFTRETNTMPQWAGSCWYYLRYIDPKNPGRFVDPEKEKYWMPVDLYVGGAEHAVLHLLYARFWHKVLFDLGHVSTPEPFARLINQGTILGEMDFHVFETAAGKPVSTTAVSDINEEMIDQQATMIAFDRVSGQKLIGRRISEQDTERKADGHYLRGNDAVRVDARSFKMSKSRGNVVSPDSIVADYGADTLRLYEMYMGPLEAQKPWNARDIVGMSRFLNSLWRNLIGDDESLQQAAPPPSGPGAAHDAPNRNAAETHPRHVTRVGDIPIAAPLDRQLHRTIKKVGEDIELLRFNTAIAELIKLNNELTGMDSIPREAAETLVLLLAPFAPHVAEELWQRLGHHKTLSRRPWPTYDESKLVETTLDIPVQVNGKLRDKITVPADFDEGQVLQAAEAAERVKPWLAGKTVVKKVYIPNKLVNFVVK